MSDFVFLGPGPLAPAVATGLVDETGVIDHIAGALSRLCIQWVGQPDLATFITIMATPATLIENAMWQLLINRTLDNATGVTLDKLGALVGQARPTLVDADYRRFIRARIAANRSHGLDEEILNVARLVINDTGLTLAVKDIGDASFTLSIRTVTVTAQTLAILVLLVQKAAGAGINCSIQSYGGLLAETFTLGTNAFVTTANAVGDTSLVVDSTSAFPTSGSILIDEGTATAETVTYTGTDATHFLGIPASGTGHLASIHAIGAACSSTVVSGAGFGSDTGDGTQGGRLGLVGYDIYAKSIAIIGPSTISLAGSPSGIYDAIATFSDGTTLDVRLNLAVWTSSNNGALSIGPSNGTYFAFSVGTYTITCTYLGATATLSVLVTA